MLNIRPAEDNDRQDVIRILKSHDLLYPGLSLENFWVAEKGHKILGVAQLNKYIKIFFLSSLGVKKDYQHQGIAKALLTQLCKRAKKIYLYTVIPAFFKKFGFEIANILLSDLPSKNRYGCEDCFPEKCVCMVKFPHAA